MKYNYSLLVTVVNMKYEIFDLSLNVKYGYFSHHISCLLCPLKKELINKNGPRTKVDKYDLLNSQK